jgi:hypothetical protein
MSANSPIVRRSLVATIISVLAVGLILTIVITLPPAASRSVVAVTGYQDSAEPAREAVLREVGLDFADHELRYAGGYGLSPAAEAERAADFDFVDHELRYAGGYSLSLPAPSRGAQASTSWTTK